MESRLPSKFKLSFSGHGQYRRALKISIILIVIMLLLIGIYHCINPKIMYNGSYFTVVVDCGSTGTRVNVYEWLTRDVNDQSLPFLVHSYPDSSIKSPLSQNDCQYHCMQTEPGLDKFVNNSSGVRASLKPLIQWAEQQIPIGRHKATPVIVLATAGLRRLPIKDSARVIRDAEDVLKEHLFMYRKSGIRVLTGKEEAYYGWVALNYKMGSLENTSTLSTSGLLDLGGSSLQVVMEIDDSREEENFMTSTIGSFEHRILAYSLPAFGLNEAFDRTVVMLSNGENTREIDGGVLEIKHPCLSSGLVQNYSCNSCFGPNSSEWKISGQIQESDSISVVLVGDQNWEQCKGLARAAAVNSSSSHCSRLSSGSNYTSPLSFNGNNLLNLTASSLPVEQFHALSGFFVVYNTLNLSIRANMTKIWDKGQHICSTPLLDSSSISGNQHHSGQYCFRLPYMASLIEDALCLGDAKIYFGPGDVSWTLGAALVEGDHKRVNTTRNSILKIKALALSPIFLFALLLGVVYIVHRCQIKLPMLGRKRNAIATALPYYINPKFRPS